MSKCAFKLRKECPFNFDVKALKENPDLIKLYCATCIKSLYARAKFKAVNRYSVVNTL